MTPIERLLTGVTMRCTICERTTDVGCDCWVTMRCPTCKLEKQAPRDATDPKGTAVVVCLCPECAGGDFSLVDYFDANGKQLDVPSDIGKR